MAFFRTSNATGYVELAETESPSPPPATLTLNSKATEYLAQNSKYLPLPKWEKSPDIDWQAEFKVLELDAKAVAAINPLPSSTSSEQLDLDATAVEIQKVESTEVTAKKPVATTAPVKPAAQPPRKAVFSIGSPDSESDDDSGYGASSGSSANASNTASPQVISPIEFIPFDSSIALTMAAKAKKIGKTDLNFSEKDVKSINDYFRMHPEKIEKARRDKKTVVISPKESSLARMMYVMPDGDVHVCFSRHTNLNDIEFTGTEKNVSLDFSLATGEMYASASLKRSDNGKLLGASEFANLKRYQGVEGFAQMVHSFTYKKQYLGGKEVEKTRIVMKFYEEGDLWKAIKARKFSEEDKVNIMRDLARAFAIMEEKGDAHRDFKPMNVLLRRDSSGVIHAVIADLSSVSQITNTEALKKHNTTSWYCSPEYARAQDLMQRAAIAGHDLDRWSFAITILQLYGLSLPWQGKSDQRVFQMIANIKTEADVEDILVTPADKTEPLYMIRKLMSIDPKERPSMKELTAFFDKVDWSLWC